MVAESIPTTSPSLSIVTMMHGVVRKYLPTIRENSAAGCWMVIVFCVVIWEKSCLRCFGSWTYRFEIQGTMGLLVSPGHLIQVFLPSSVVSVHESNDCESTIVKFCRWASPFGELDPSSDGPTSAHSSSMQWSDGPKPNLLIIAPRFVT